MCPLCFGTATLLLSGGTSAGGLAVMLLSKPFRKRRGPASTTAPGTATGVPRLGNPQPLAPRQLR